MLLTQLQSLMKGLSLEQRAQGPFALFRAIGMEVFVGSFQLLWDINCRVRSLAAHSWPGLCLVGGGSTVGYLGLQCRF